VLDSLPFVAAGVSGADESELGYGELGDSRAQRAAGPAHTGEERTHGEAKIARDETAHVSEQSV
jgi:hypothetical protein